MRAASQNSRGREISSLNSLLKNDRKAKAPKSSAKKACRQPKPAQVVIDIEADPIPPYVSQTRLGSQMQTYKKPPRTTTRKEERAAYAKKISTAIAEFQMTMMRCSPKQLRELRREDYDHIAEQIDQLISLLTQFTTIRKPKDQPLPTLTESQRVTDDGGAVGRLQ
jgi:hypothetical protein